MDLFGFKKRKLAKEKAKEEAAKALEMENRRQKQAEMLRVKQASTEIRIASRKVAAKKEEYLDICAKAHIENDKDSFEQAKQKYILYRDLERYYNKTLLDLEKAEIYSEYRKAADASKKALDDSNSIADREKKLFGDAQDDYFGASADANEDVKRMINDIRHDFTAEYVASEEDPEFDDALCKAIIAKEKE